MEFPHNPNIQNSFWGLLIPDRLAEETASSLLLGLPVSQWGLLNVTPLMLQ